MPLRITKITSDPAIQDLLKTLGNHDDFLTPNEIPIDQFGMLPCNPSAISWSTSEFNSVQSALFNAGLIGKLNDQICTTPESNNYQSVEKSPFTSIEFKKLDKDKLEALLSRQDYVMPKDQLPTLKEIPFVRDLMAKIAALNISTVDELSDELIHALKDGIKYNGKLGAETTTRSEVWHFEEQQAICDSLGRMYCALFDLMVETTFPEFSAYKALRMTGMAVTSLDDYLSSHAYNIIIRREAGQLRIKIVDPTWGLIDCTNVRMADVIYALYKAGVISREETIEQLDAMTKIDPTTNTINPGRKLAMVNRILINNENIESKIQSMEMICHYIKGIEQLTTEEINYVLGMPIEEYLIFGDQKSWVFADISIYDYAAGVSARAKTMMDLLSHQELLIEPLHSHLEVAQMVANTIMEKIKAGDVQEATELTEDLKNILACVGRTRKNQSVVKDLLGKRIV